MNSENYTKIVALSLSFFLLLHILYLLISLLYTVDSVLYFCYMSWVFCVPFTSFSIGLLPNLILAGIVDLI